jgi:hypothetical protein
VIRRSGRIGHVLLRSIAGPEQGLDELVRGADLRALPAAGAFHGVTGWVHHSLAACPSADPGLVAEVRHNYHQARLIHLRTLADLALIGRAFDELGASWLVAKGPVLAEALYDRADLRTYTDLDLFVAPVWFGRALDALEAIGARLLDRNWRHLRETMVSELHLAAPHGTVVELHFHLLNEARERDRFSVPMAELYERPRRVQVGERTVPTLDPVDTLVYVCLHACLSGADRLVWLKDVQHAAAPLATRWDDVVRRSRQFGAGMAVAYMLASAREATGMDVPAEVVWTLGRSASWTALASVVRRLWPPERSAGSCSPSRTLARSTGRDLRATRREAARRTYAGLRGPRGDPGYWDWMRQEVGSRAAFVAAVAATEEARVALSTTGAGPVCAGPRS